MLRRLYCPSMKKYLMSNIPFPSSTHWWYVLITIHSFDTRISIIALSSYRLVTLTQALWKTGVWSQEGQAFSCSIPIAAISKPKSVLRLSKVTKSLTCGLVISPRWNGGIICIWMRVSPLWYGFKVFGFEPGDVICSFVSLDGRSYHSW